MNFVDEEHSRNNVSFPFFPPLWNFLVYLLSNFLSNLSCGSGEESQKSLRARVDDINFMQGNSVDYLFTLLDFSFWTVNKSSLWAHGIVVRCSCKASASLRDLSWSLIDGDDVSSDDLFLLNGFDHLLAQIVDGFHLSGFESDFASFGARGWVAKNILDDFSISISTTSPSTISLSSFILTPIDRLKAWVNASVLLISREKIYEPASIVKGTSSPRLLAIAMAMAVLPVPGCPPMRMALPAILPSLISSRMIPAALLASTWIEFHLLDRPCPELFAVDLGIRWFPVLEYESEFLFFRF